MILLFPIHPSAKTHAMFRRLFKKVRIPVTVNRLSARSPNCKKLYFGGVAPQGETQITHGREVRTKEFQVIGVRGYSAYEDRWILFRCRSNPGYGSYPI